MIIKKHYNSCMIYVKLYKKTVNLPNSSLTNSVQWWGSPVPVTVGCPSKSSRPGTTNLQSPSAVWFDSLQAHNNWHYPRTKLIKYFLLHVNPGQITPWLINMRLSPRSLGLNPGLPLHQGLMKPRSMQMLNSRTAVDMARSYRTQW